MFLCSLCRPEREAAAEAAPAPAAGGPALVPPQQTVLGRSKSEARILTSAAAGSSQFVRSQSMPAVALLEVSRRRLLEGEARQQAAAAAAKEAADGQVAMAFVQTYMQALRDGNAAWASAPAVGQLFADDAVLVAVDRSTHHGKPAVLKRLNAGMEQLLTMAGAASEAQLPAFELQGPSPGPEGAMVVTLKLRRGLQRLSFVMTFRLVEGRIVHLQNARS